MHCSLSCPDAITISQAYLKARDEDIIKLLNAFSATAENDLKDLAFYVVPADWLKKAWSVLNTGNVPKSLAAKAGDWREGIGSIENSGLTFKYHSAISIVDDEEKPDKEEQQKNLVLDELQKRTSQKSNLKTKRRLYTEMKETLRTDIQHQKDFFLIGPNVWLLIKQKFGVDKEICLKCVKYNSVLSPLAVELYPPGLNGSNAVYIPVPPTGRFNYEYFLSEVEVSSSSNNRHPSSVSDDDTAECGDDLFPTADDDRMSLDQQANSQPVILLPMSTTNDNDTTKPSWLQTNGVEDDKSINMITGKFHKRRYGSGLGNLGNTCFMNSTLQCLAHTDPLCDYFLSGEYKRDLNRDNPLGTGGDLATQFSQLLGEIWGAKSHTINGGYSNTNSVVYPRNFKFALGRHAEQFVGYDQHDSQELATYLLDALHEDTNRVSKKPYVEKPEQGDDESDDKAADKAWALHFKREDSKILEYFMGQVKSRVQCCKEECQRVSTTFDPFMYLSVPIPGSSDRTIRVTFIPLDPTKRAQNISVSLKKNGKIEDLLIVLIEQINLFKNLNAGGVITSADLCVADVWQREIYTIFQSSDDLDKIRDNDDTFVYQLRQLSEVREIEKSSSVVSDAVALDALPCGLRERSSPRRFKLDLPTLTRLNTNNNWVGELTKYLRSELTFHTHFNAKRGSTVEQVKLYNKLMIFIDQCYQDADPDLTGQKRSREDSKDFMSEDVQLNSDPNDVEVPAIRDRCDSSALFQHVSRRHDVAILEFLAGRLRSEILRLEKARIQAFPDGITLQVRLRKQFCFMTKEQNIAAPLILRVPSCTTVYGLREILAKRLSRSLTERLISVNESTTKGDSAFLGNDATTSRFGSPELLVICQVPLTYECRNLSSYRSYNGTGSKLGVLEKKGHTNEHINRNNLARPTDAEEKISLAEVLSDHAVVHMEWPEELADQYLDINELEAVDTPILDNENETESSDRQSSVLTVLDCIEKFCQMEQLEESDMWYCNRCKEHVRAWKQFHLYRTPPILIIHLKRFQYSASTHRRDKIGGFIDFPLEGLDLTQHVMHWEEDEKPIYDCYAVSNHYGGLGGGHYTAYALTEDNVWCHYDDSRVTSHVDPNDVVSQAAYVLYYRRRDVPVGQFSFASGAQSPVSQTLVTDRGPLNEEPAVSDDASLTNVPMIDEDDGMDVDETDLGSRSVGSMDGNTDQLSSHNFDSIDRDILDETSDTRFPAQ